MTSLSVRKMVRIDEEKCDGCGACVPACAEGALEITDGKARLVSETYCDGLGACLGECPRGAISIEEREVEPFNEEAARHHVESKARAAAVLPCGCPGSAVTEFHRAKEAACAPCAAQSPSMLSHWPVQLALVPPSAPFLQDADVVLAADCVPFACADFHRDFLGDHALLVACPKPDDYEAQLRRLTEILAKSRIRSLKVVHMDVACCYGLKKMAAEAVRLSGKDIPLEEVTMSIRGERIDN
ncbi:MAG: 4Fe-4S binding protein [Dehalococcoidia bacterium]|nr:4Fe-4S binding protein [Dehalococcoidia bacterium]